MWVTLLNNVLIMFQFCICGRKCLKIIYFHWLAVEPERQQQAGHIRLSGAVLICLWHLYTVSQLVGHQWLYHCGDEGLLWKPWGLNANRGLMLLGKLASELCPPPHYKNPTLSSNKGQKLAARSNDKAKGRRVERQGDLTAQHGGGISYTLRVWAEGGR